MGRLEPNDIALFSVLALVPFTAGAIVGALGAAEPVAVAAGAIASLAGALFIAGGTGLLLAAMVQAVLVGAWERTITSLLGLRLALALWGMARRATREHGSHARGLAAVRMAVKQALRDARPVLECRGVPVRPTWSGESR